MQHLYMHMTLTQLDREKQRLLNDKTMDDDEKEMRLHLLDETIKEKENHNFTKSEKATL